MLGWKTVNSMSQHTDFDKEKWQKNLAKLPGADIPWLHILREKAIHYFQQQGWPQRKQEAWKYTPTQLLQKQGWDLNQDRTVSFHVTPTDHLHIESCTATDIQNHSALFKANEKDTAPTLLNHALWQEAWIIRVNKSVHDNTPLRIILPALKAGQTHYIKLIFIVAAKANLQVIMDHTESAGFTNIMIHTCLAEAAQMTFLDHCDAGDSSLHFIHHTVTQNAHSTFNHYALALHTEWLRHELIVHFNEPHACCQLNGLYFGVAKQFVDHHLCVNHHAPHCQSNQFYKGVLADQAHAVFNGKVIVAKNAQKTISAQKNHNILLSNSAEIDSKPELEIYADDVLCAHGATVGALSTDALFYLISRGIEPAQAKKILLEAFMQEISLQCIPFAEEAKQAVANRLTEVYLDQI